MKSKDIATILDQNLSLLDNRQSAFYKSVRKSIRLGAALTPAQHQYLQAVYDSVVSRKYGLGPMAGDGEYAARRAIARNARGRGLGK